MLRLNLIPPNRLGCHRALRRLTPPCTNRRPIGTQATAGQAPPAAASRHATALTGFEVVDGRVPQVAPSGHHPSAQKANWLARGYRRRTTTAVPPRAAASAAINRSKDPMNIGQGPGLLIRALFAQQRRSAPRFHVRARVRVRSALQRPVNSPEDAAVGVLVGSTQRTRLGHANSRAQRSALGPSKRSPSPRVAPPTQEQACSQSVSRGTCPADPSATHRAAEGSARCAVWVAGKQ